VGLCRIDADDLVHVVARREATARGDAPDVAVCGRQIVAHLDTGYVPDDYAGCHVCLPSLAHPLAEVWATCRRWDADANARACLEPARAVTPERSAC
jgi:hypothetical protein